MNIRGRHPQEAIHLPEWTGRMAGPVVRVDDDNHLDFWLEIILSPDDIQEAYDYMKGQGHYDQSVPSSSDENDSGK